MAVETKGKNKSNGDNVDDMYLNGDKREWRAVWKAVVPRRWRSAARDKSELIKRLSGVLRGRVRTLWHPEIRSLDRPPSRRPVVEKNKQLINKLISGVRKRLAGDVIKNVSKLEYFETPRRYWIKLDDSGGCYKLKVY